MKDTVSFYSSLRSLTDKWAYLDFKNRSWFLFLHCFFLHLRLFKTALSMTFDDGCTTSLLAPSHTIVREYKDGCCLTRLTPFISITDSAITPCPRPVSLSSSRRHKIRDLTARGLARPINRARDNFYNTTIRF